MPKRWFRPFAMIGFTAAVLLSDASLTHAQIGEARGRNWDNAKRLYYLIVTAVDARNRDEAYKLTGEFRDNLDYVQDKLERTGQRLHEKDRGWLGDKPGRVVDKVRRTKVAAGILGSKIRDVGSSPSSELSDFKSQWNDFATSFDELWKDYAAHGKELNDILKAFREDCRGCD